MTGLIVIIVVIFVIGCIVSSVGKKDGNSTRKTSFAERIKKWADIDDEDEDGKEDYYTKTTTQKTTVQQPIKREAPKSGPSFDTIGKPKVYESKKIIEEVQESEELDRAIEKIEPEATQAEIITEATKCVDSTIGLSLYTFSDPEKLEITKLYNKNHETLSFSSAEKKEIVNANYQGSIDRINDGNYFMITIGLNDLASDFYKSLGFTANDQIYLCIVIDTTKKLIDLNIKKINEKSFTKEETGNFLFSYPELKNVGLSFGQFSYYKASEIMKLFYKEFEELMK